MTDTTKRGGYLPVWFAVGAAAVSPAWSAAQAPQVGDVQRLPVITVSLSVGSTEKEAKQVVYTPPPGWYVRSHSVECAVKQGNSSYTVNTVPAGWGWFSEATVRESYKVLIDLAGEAQDAGLRAKFLAERDRMLAELRKARSTHHALVVEATAKGEGFLRGGGGLQLTVAAELVYLGTEESLNRTVAAGRGLLKGSGK